MKTKPRVSVVVSVHNGAHKIGGCLRSLGAQKGLQPGEMEVVVVDDRSSDGLHDRLSQEGLDGLRVFRIEDHVAGGLSARQTALDLGFGQSRGEVVCLLDDDGHAPEGWVRSLLDLLEGTGAHGVAGPVNFRSGKAWIRALQTVDAYYYLRVCQMLNGLGMKAGVLFGNFAFRRSAYDDVGGFKGIGFSLTEDLAFARRLRESGHGLAFDFDKAVEVSACHGLGELIERAKRVSCSGGISVLAAVLGCWMLTLPLLLVGAVLGLPGLLHVLAIRYGAGVAHAAWGALKAGRPAALAMAFVYEPLTILIGLVVWLKRLGSRQIEWGGIRYGG